jgi:hypothetical protein
MRGRRARSATASPASASDSYARPRDGSDMLRRSGQRTRGRRPAAARKGTQALRHASGTLT